MSTPPQPSPPQQPWASAPLVRDATPRRPFLATPLGLFLLVFALVVLLSVAALTYALVQRNQTPIVHIPSPNPPNSNAFDLYVKAGKEIVREKEIDEAVSTEPKRKFALTKKKVLVAANQKALAAFRSGFGLPYRDRPVRSIHQMMPYYKDFRNGARLMSLEGRIKQEKGNASGAASAGLDAVQFGRQISEGASALGGLVSMACQAIGRRVVWDNRARLKAAQAKAAARRMERLCQIGASASEIFTEEKYATQSATLELFRDPEGFAKEINQPNTSEKSKPSATITGESENPGISGADWKFIFLVYGKRRLFDNVTGYMDKAIAQAGRRYGADHAAIPEPQDPLSLTMLPDLAQTRYKFVVTDTQNALLMTDLALRAYKGERGAYPESVDALVPAYLSRLPDDPFAQSGTLRYRRTLDGFLLYSVGPDGKDDNGKPIQNTDSKTNYEKRLAKEKSRGDIVAGVNQ